MGPYETEAHAVADIPPVDGDRRAALLGRLVDACDAAGVDLGAYDLRVAAWLAGWEPQVVQAVVDWIDRAGADRFGTA